MPESLLGLLLWGGGRERFELGRIIPSEFVRPWERLWLEGSVL